MTNEKLKQLREQVEKAFEKDQAEEGGRYRGYELNTLVNSLSNLAVAESNEDAIAFRAWDRQRIEAATADAKADNERAYEENQRRYEHSKAENAARDERDVRRLATYESDVADVKRHRQVIEGVSERIAVALETMAKGSA